MAPFSLPWFPIRTDPALTRPLKGIRVRVPYPSWKGVPYASRTGRNPVSDGCLSGISVMQLSRLVSIHKHTRILLDLMPDYSQKQVQSLLGRMHSLLQSEPAERLLAGFNQQTGGQTLVKQIVPLNRPIGSLSSAELDEIGRRMKAWEFPVCGVGAWKNAQVRRVDLAPPNFIVKQWNPVWPLDFMPPERCWTSTAIVVDSIFSGRGVPVTWAGRCAVQHLLGGNKHDSYFRVIPTSWEK